MPKSKRQTPKETYIERVRSALTMSSAMELSKDDYIDALDTIGDEINGMAEAAREERESERKDGH